MRSFLRVVLLILLLFVVFTLIGGLWYIWALARGQEVKLPSIRIASATPSAYVITRTPPLESPAAPGYPYPAAPSEPIATLAPTAAPVEIPNGWAYFEDPDLQVGFAYPAGWQPSAGNQARLEGEDGFASLERFDGPGLTLDQACEWEANHDRTRYGNQPELHLVQPYDLPTCQILTSLSAGGGVGSGLLLVAPEQAQPARFLILHADPLHFPEIAQSVRLAGGGTLTLTPSPVPQQPASAGTPEVTMQRRAREWNGLVWAEYGVALASEDTPVHLEFDRRVPAVVLDERQADQNQAVSARLEATNTDLLTFGYRLEPSNANDPNSTLSLYQGNQLLLRDVFDYQPLAVNASGDDFRLVLDTRSGYRVLSADGLQAWDITGHDFIPPVYLGNQLLEISSTDFGQVRVMLDGEAVYTYSVAEHPVESPVRSLQSDGEHWVLLVNGMLVVDGEIQNQSLDADEVFGWQMLAGRPFFFFVRAGRVGVRYGDQEQAGLYDEVIHDRCCEAAAFNPRAFADATWYYARDAGEWYLVRLATGP